MEHSPYWEANSRSASQDIYPPLWNPKVHFRVRKVPLKVPVLIQMNPAHTFPNYLRSILILSSNLRLGFVSGKAITRNIS
jgi:hypothetical protein